MSSVLRRDELKKSEPKDFVKAIAMNIGKNVACYIETMYPEAVSAASSSFLLSLRNDVYNEIMSAFDPENASKVSRTLERHKDFRRKQKAIYKKIRSQPAPSIEAQAKPKGEP